MKKHIAEDLPSRPHPQASLSAKPQSGGAGGGDGGRPEKKDSNKESESTPDKRIRQAVYDIKYRARRENIPLRSAYSQYMQNSSMSEMEKSEVRKRLFGGEGGVQSENFEFEMKDFASRSMANALYKVFVEKKNQPIDIDRLKIELEEKTHFNKYNNNVKKYKVTVFDPKNEVSYVRYATREKINELRSKGLKVEFTEYGSPYEGEREKGEQTSKALGGGGKGKKPNDGNLANNYPPYDKVTRGDVVAGRLGKDQMGGKNVKENFFLGEVSATANLPQMNSSEYANPNANPKQLDVATTKNKIVVNPPENKGTTASHGYNRALFAHNELEGELISENGYSKFLKLLQEKKMTASKKKKEKKLKTKYDKSGMKASMQQQYGDEKGKKVYFATIRKQAMKEDSDCGCEDSKGDKQKSVDKRSLPTTKSLIQSKFQSMGFKNPIVMTAGYEPDGEVLDERRREDRGKPRPPRNPAMEFIRGIKGIATRSGGTVGQHQQNRGVGKLKKQSQETAVNPETGERERIRPTSEGPTPAKKVEMRRARQASANETMRNMYRPRPGESD